MLRITIPPGEFWDEEKGEFVYTKEQTLQLEHSLVSISKWESRWHKSFISNKDKTTNEVIDYIKCMTLTPNVKSITYKNLTNENMKQINDYIDDSMTATYFREEETSVGVKETITSELIYYLMIANNIPFECQKWHLNRLIALIKVCSMKNKPAKTMSKQEILERNAKLNAERRKQLNTTG